MLFRVHVYSRLLSQHKLPPRKVMVHKLCAIKTMRLGIRLWSTGTPETLCTSRLPPPTHTHTTSMAYVCVAAVAAAAASVVVWWFSHVLFCFLRRGYFDTCLSECLGISCCMLSFVLVPFRRYGGPGGHKIGNITLPSLESCDYTPNPVVRTGPAPTAPVFKIYHGEISKPQVQQRLKKVGEYLVRDSSQGPGKLALCVRMHAQVGNYPCCKHTNPIFTCLIETLPGGTEYRVQKHTPTFPSLEELVMHYQNHKIVVAKPHTMTQPCPPPGAHASAEAEDDGYEHPKEAYAVFKGTGITFDVKDELGHGNFGIVCKGACIFILRARSGDLDLGVHLN